MGKTYTIIVPFHNPFSWHTDYANQTAHLLTRNHTVVCFLWGDTVSLKEILWNHLTYRPLTHSGNLWTYQPLFCIPGKRYYPIQVINLILNTFILHIIGFILTYKHHSGMLLWMFGFFDPAFLYLPACFPRTPIVFDSVDYPWHQNPVFARRFKEETPLLARKAWIVTANSRTLTEMLRKTRADTVTVPVGFRKEMFIQSVPIHLPVPDTRPIIGFVGAIDYRLDYPLLERLIRHNPAWQFALIGHIFYDNISPMQQKAVERILKLPNVTHMSVAQESVPPVLKKFSVAIIPYDNRLPFNRYAFPMKFMEYMYAGKPVVSSRVSELRHYPHVHVASTERTWKQAIIRAIHTPPTATQKRAMRAHSLLHTWEKKIDAITSLIRSRE